MKTWRAASLRRCIREGEYFKALSKMLDLAQREMSSPTRRRRGEKILMDLRNDADYLQENYCVVKIKRPS